jgi:hypothetical protein
MKIEKGWRFYSADFSINANEGNMYYGQVMFRRNSKNAKLWHLMSDELKDTGPPLFVSGKGITLEEAIKDANKNARNAAPIILD